MKSVLISIQPKWCELIVNGEKTIEVRKTKPKLETPFKVYIYCTKGELQLTRSHRTNEIYLTYSKYINRLEQNGNKILSGKVIGEFVCDEIYTINKDSCGWFYENGNYAMGIFYAEETEELYHCIPDDELKHYLGHMVGYGWHISNLVIYDKPRELSEFYTKCDEGCEDCDFWKSVRVNADEYDMECSSSIYGHRTLKRPPQSWFYVERSGNNA